MDQCFYSPATDAGTFSIRTGHSPASLKLEKWCIGPLFKKFGDPCPRTSNDTNVQNGSNFYFYSNANNLVAQSLVSCSCLYKSLSFQNATPLELLLLQPQCPTFFFTSVIFFWCKSWATKPSRSSLKPSYQVEGCLFLFASVRGPRPVGLISCPRA